MLTNLAVRNFKRFGSVDIELGSPVVFIGPNNSGKTSAMQALALWDIGLRRWNEKRSGQKTPEKRPRCSGQPPRPCRDPGFHTPTSSGVDSKSGTCTG